MLSVSSVGSEAMQPGTAMLEYEDKGDLSVSSVGSEAMQLQMLADAGPLLLLSVSSVGSEAMQRRSPMTWTRRRSCFQYPRSDRRRCNPTLNC